MVPSPHKPPNPSEGEGGRVGGARERGGRGEGEGRERGGRGEGEREGEMKGEREG